MSTDTEAVRWWEFEKKIHSSGWWRKNSARHWVSISRYTCTHTSPFSLRTCRAHL